MLITGFAAGVAEANCYLLAPRPGAAAVVIDPGEDAVSTLEYYFAANDLTPAAVLLTHGHRGHTLSAYDLGVGWDIPVYLHPADRELLPDPPEHIIDIADGQQLLLAGIEIAVEHTPGHTAGSVVYRVTADTDEGPVPVAFTGDTLGFRSIGRGKCDSDPRQLRESIRSRLLTLDDATVLFPGHGSSTTVGGERRYDSELAAQPAPNNRSEPTPVKDITA